MNEKQIDLTRDGLIKTLKGQAGFLGANYGVKRIGLFGSFARGEQKSGSDVDLVVELEKPLGFKFIDLSEYLEKLLNRKLDVLTLAGLKGMRVRGAAENIQRDIIYV